MQPINLEDFIEMTLTQIIQGVKKSQENVENLGGKVSPNLYWADASAAPLYTEDAFGKIWAIQMVDFEVGITTIETEEGQRSIGVGGLVGASMPEKSITEAESVGTIKFSVPVALPKN